MQEYVSAGLLSYLGAFCLRRVQEYVLAGLLIDLSLLDQYMFRFRPGTLASSALFLARVSAVFYSKVQYVVRKLMGVVVTCWSLTLRLLVCAGWSLAIRPHIIGDDRLTTKPSGIPCRFCIVTQFPVLFALPDMSLISNPPYISVSPFRVPKPSD